VSNWRVVGLWNFGPLARQVIASERLSLNLIDEHVVGTVPRFVQDRRVLMSSDQVEAGVHLEGAQQLLDLLFIPLLRRFLLQPVMPGCFRRVLPRGLLLDAVKGTRLRNDM